MNDYEEHICSEILKTGCLFLLGPIRSPGPILNSFAVAINLVTQLVQW